MDSRFLIGIGITLLVQAAGIVWWASSLQSAVQHNDFQIKMMSKDVDKNSSFVELWPAGKWGSGSLPSDVKQDLKIERLEMLVGNLTDKIYGPGKHNHIRNGRDDGGTILPSGVYLYQMTVGDIKQNGKMLLLR